MRVRHRALARASFIARGLFVEPLEHRAYLTAISFGAASAMPTGGDPQGVAVGDFNSDGKADFVFADFSAGEIVVKIGNGSGGFANAVRYAASSNLSGVSVGDLNGDGKPDIVATGDNVSVLINHGDGTFNAATHLTVGNTPQNSTLADVNGNGKLDIITANVLDTVATVSLGSGSGTFPTQKSPAVPAQADIAVGDLNGDGKVDLAVALFGNTSTGAGAGFGVVTGKGDGTFNAPVTYATPAGSHPSAIRLGDFNGDGKLDAVIANGGLADLGGTNNFSLFINKGNGTYNAAVNIASGSIPNALIVADFNNDGVLDVAAPNSIVGSGGKVLIHQGKGDGTFLAPVGFTISGGSPALATADFNSDGQPDLIVSNTTNHSVDLLLNTSGFATVTNGLLTVNGTSAADKISITSKSHRYYITRNSDTVSFASSSITHADVFAGEGNDTVDFSTIALNTYVDAGGGNDVVTAGAGNDSLAGAAGKDILHGGAGIDRLTGGASPDQLFGEDGNDRIYGGDGDDRIDGGGGVDRIYGENGADLLFGGASNDRIYGGIGNDTLSGGKGNDLLDGGDGADTHITDVLDRLVSIEV